MKICLKSLTMLILVEFIFINQCNAIKWRLRNGQTVSPDVVIKTINSLEVLSKQNLNLLQNFCDYCWSGAFSKELSIDDFKTLKKLELFKKNGEISKKICSLVSSIILKPTFSNGKIIKINISCPLDMARFERKSAWIGWVANTSLSAAITRLVELGIDYLWDLIRKSYNDRYRLKRRTAQAIEQSDLKFDVVFDENGKVKKEIRDILLDVISA